MLHNFEVYVKFGGVFWKLDLITALWCNSQDTDLTPWRVVVQYSARTSIFFNIYKIWLLLFDSIRGY